MATQLDPGTKPAVGMFISSLHERDTEADEAVGSKGTRTAAKGAWLLPVPKGSCPAPLPQGTLKNPRTIE